MKTFQDFNSTSSPNVIEEGEFTHYLKHYSKAALRAVIPGYNDIRQMSSQNQVDKFNLHASIAKDRTLPMSTRKKYAAKAQKNLEKLAGKLHDPSFANINDVEAFDMAVEGVNESVLAHKLEYYKDAYKRITAPHPNRARRMQTQHHIDQFRLNQDISNDMSIPIGKREKAASKARMHSNYLKSLLQVDKDADLQRYYQSKSQNQFYQDNQRSYSGYQSPNSAERETIGRSRSYSQIEDGDVLSWSNDSTVFNPHNRAGRHA